MKNKKVKLLLLSIAALLISLFVYFVINMSDFADGIQDDMKKGYNNLPDVVVHPLDNGSEIRWIKIKPDTGSDSDSDMK